MTHFDELFYDVFQSLGSGKDQSVPVAVAGRYNVRELRERNLLRELTHDPTNWRTCNEFPDSCHEEPNAKRSWYLHAPRQVPARQQRQQHLSRYYSLATCHAVVSLLISFLIL